jgi:hypothetical protein
MSEFDKFVWDGSAWTGSIVVRGGVLVDVEILPDPDADQPQISELARHCIAQLQERESEYRYAVADRLLELYNTRWSQFETLNHEAFASRIQLDAVVVYGEEHVELFYEDGDLFQGQAILLTLDGNAQVDGATLAG